MNFCDNMSVLDDITVKCNIPDGYEQTGYIIKRKDIDFSAIDYGGTVDKPAALNMGTKATLSLTFSNSVLAATYNGTTATATATARKIYYNGATAYALALVSSALKVYSATITETALLSSYSDLVDATTALPSSFTEITTDTTDSCYFPTYSAASTVALPSTVIDAFSLVSGAKAYKISQLKNAFTDTEKSMEAGDYKNTFTNTLAFKIFDQGPKVAAIVNGLANGEYVVILEQKDKSIDAYQYASGESKWRVFGIENGLTASEITNNAYDESIGNGWSVKMEEKASSSCDYFIFKTDLTTTDALIASLY